MDFDNLARIIQNVFSNELFISSDEHRMIVSEPPGNPKKNREELV